VVAVVLAAGSLLGGSRPARAAGARAAAPEGMLSVQGAVLAVTATSPSDAWAGGYLGTSGGALQMLIAHWNGRRWSLAGDLPPGEVTQISMDAPDDVWAIAESGNGEAYVIHWNGRTWSQDTSLPPVVAYLNAVVAVGGDVWVTGAANGPGRTSVQVMLHRTRGRWYVVPMPIGPGYLDAFAATSRTSIWAGGSILAHWNGTRWQATSVLKAKGLSFVESLAPGPGGSVWAVATNSNSQSVSLHWNGRTWVKVPFPAASGLGNTLNSVTSIPHGTAWAVGGSLNSTGSKQTALILHWSGRAWTSVRPPATTQGSVTLYDVTATSPDSAWAVGVSKCIQEHCTQYATILRWNGRTWS
jgi:hypothetical protein